MAENLFIESSTAGQVMIGTVLPNGCPFPILVFANINTFTSFVGRLEAFIAERRPPIPQVFIQAFQEEEKDSVK